MPTGVTLFARGVYIVFECLLSARAEGNLVDVPTRVLDGDSYNNELI